MVKKTKKYIVSEGDMFINGEYVGKTTISPPIPSRKVKFSWNSPLGQYIKSNPILGIQYLIRRMLIK